VKQSLVAAALVALASTRAFAQVGYTPEHSPYRDVEFKQELTLLTGYFGAAKDPAGVAPRSGPLLGARYEVRIGGPAEFTARLARVWSERHVIDPTKPAATRSLGVQSWPLYVTDVGISINLTGQKSLHELVPVLNGGIGLVSDLKGKADVGGYKFGTSFAFSFGGGVRYVPGGNFQLRADVADYLYQIQYPDTYFGDATTVLRGASNSVWKHNVALTVGASYLFYR
jgi:hypothetical protein